jgi:ATP-dependent HslUV protease ATP-binding subunit HslU
MTFVFASTEVNASIENIGARRLYTILEKVFENLSYSAPDQKEKEIIINKDFVNINLEKFAKSSDISRYVL